MIEIALLEQEASRLARVQIARQPTDGPGTRAAFDTFRRLANERSLLVFVHAELMRPTISVRTHFVTALRDRRGDLWSPFERDGGRREGGGDTVPGEQTQNPRRTFIDAVGVIALVTEVANRLFERDAEFIDWLWAAIPVLNIELSALLDIDDDRQREACTARPGITHQ